MVVNLSLDKGGQVVQDVDFGIANVLHPAIDVVVGLFILCLLCSQFLLQTEVLLLRLLNFGEGSVIGQPATFELLPGCLDVTVSWCSCGPRLAWIQTWYSFIWARDRSRPSSQLEVACDT